MTERNKFEVKSKAKIDNVEVQSERKDSQQNISNGQDMSTHSMLVFLFYLYLILSHNKHFNTDKLGQNP